MPVRSYWGIADSTLLLGLFGVALHSMAVVPAMAHTPAVHRLMTQWALLSEPPVERDWGNGPGVDDLAAFRDWLYLRLSTMESSELRQRFLHRYPSLQRFRVADLKLFLGLNPVARIQGIDGVPAAGDFRAIMEKASALPATDGRNRPYDLLAPEWRENKGGSAISGAHIFDPAILNISVPGGVSAESWAHCGLPANGLSLDAESPTEHPSKFLRHVGFPPGPVFAAAPQMAQIHT